MVLDFSLSPDATGRIYELLACLAKFGDTVSVEARAEKASSAKMINSNTIHAAKTSQQLTLTALNSSRTAYASFSLDPRTFFINYNFDVRNPPGKSDRFTCQLYNRVSLHLPCHGETWKSAIDSGLGASICVQGSKQRWSRS